MEVLWYQPRLCVRFFLYFCFFLCGCTTSLTMTLTVRNWKCFRKEQNSCWIREVQRWLHLNAIACVSVRVSVCNWLCIRIIYLIWEHRRTFWGPENEGILLKVFVPAVVPLLLCCAYLTWHTFYSETVCILKLGCMHVQVTVETVLAKENGPFSPRTFWHIAVRQAQV